MAKVFVFLYKPKNLILTYSVKIIQMSILIHIKPHIDYIETSLKEVMTLFPERRRKQLRQDRPRHAPNWIGKPTQPRKQDQTSSGVMQLLTNFRDQEGQVDFNKVTEVASQVNKLYGQVSPLLSSFFKK
ncbi:hypothetical protein A21D_00084 [Virgibacillus dokdonensis]|uniref:YppG-like protein n=2 Tax=Virgibacillus dokdonensis TaxID=302167 RepID=A0A2K9J2H5_9BACI|nr:hypothetical protein A21D_00084 [Virgibacillus dokdonensis]